jgi:hypothetical protein
MKEENGNDFIDIDFENLDKGKFNLVEYQGDFYSIENWPMVTWHFTR